MRNDLVINGIDFNEQLDLLKINLYNFIDSPRSLDNKMYLQEQEFYDYQNYLIRIACSSFGVPISELVKHYEQH